MARHLFIATLLVTILAGCASTQKHISDFAIGIERCRSDLTAKTLELDEKHFSYLERTGPGQTIVLLHGFTAEKNNWLRFVRQFPPEYRVIVPDMVGHGDNPWPGGEGYNLATIITGFTQIVDGLELETFHLAGNSLGGLVSTQYAADNPDRVLTLGLFDPAGVISEQSSDLMLALDRGENPFRIETRDDFDQLLQYTFHDIPFAPWPIYSVMAREYIQRNDFHMQLFDALIASEPFTSSEFARRLLPRVSVPTFVLWGAKDRLLHVSSMKVFEEFLPQMEGKILPGCGHCPMMEQPRQSANLYLDFLQRHSNSR